MIEAAEKKKKAAGAVTKFIPVRELTP
jgi:hypothetical protein